jgi:hypothetical protein
VVERCFNRLKQFRALATRYAKRVAYYRSEIIIAAIVLWLAYGTVSKIVCEAVIRQAGAVAPVGKDHC